MEDGLATLSLRLAFYYPWFPRNWTQLGIYPYANYHPSLGYYDSADPRIIQAHIAALQYSKFDGAISSWWGQGSDEDLKFPLLLQASLGHALQWCVYYELEGSENRSIPQIQSDFQYIVSRYAAHQNYLHVDGRPVIFVYGKPGDGPEQVERYVTGNAVAGAYAYLVLKVFPGFQTCQPQPDGWHEYAPANAVRDFSPWSYTISPGFWKVGEQPRLARDLNQWQRNVAAMKLSQASFKLVTTFNEHGEGTPVESCVEWNTASGHGAYLDALTAGPPHPCIVKRLSSKLRRHR